MSDEKEATVSTITRTRPTTTRSTLSRRQMLKAGGGAAVTGLAVAGPKPSKAFAAPAFLQGEQITLRYGTWFWNEPGRAEAWRYMIEKFHEAQSDIRIEESGAPCPISSSGCCGRASSPRCRT